MRRLIAGNISALDLQLLFDSIVPEALVVVIPFAIVVGVECIAVVRGKNRAIDGVVLRGCGCGTVLVLLIVL